MLQCMSLVLAQSGHPSRTQRCLLSGVKQTRRKLTPQRHPVAAQRPQSRFPGGGRYLAPGGNIDTPGDTPSGKLRQIMPIQWGIS
jgi:hypothetical protein